MFFVYMIYSNVVVSFVFQPKILVLYVRELIYAKVPIK